MKIGQEIGKLARQSFPDGLLLPSGQHERAAEATQAALVGDAPVLFEATFVAEGLQARCDILERNADGTWTLIEVKSGVRVKEPDHIEDVAFQAIVLRAAGLRVRDYRLMHLDKEYTHDGGPYDPKRIFQSTDITAMVLDTIPRLTADLEAVRALAGQTEAPDFQPNTYCRDCEFKAKCHENLPPGGLWQLPGINVNSVRKLASQGLRVLDDVTSAEQLSPSNRLAYKVISSQQDFTDPDLIKQLERLPGPIGFVDFEAIDPALPKFVGHHPYERVPFQWSLHVIPNADSTQEPEWRDYLHTDVNQDPRVAFAATLWEAVQDCNSLVFYSDYEVATLKMLKDAGVPYGQELYNKFKTVGYDLYKAIKGKTYWTSFNGSYSIKNVLPAVNPAISYKSLNVQNGAVAVQVYEEYLDPTTSDEKRAAIIDDLRAYCQLDTYAMLALYQGFRAAVPGWAPANA
ncbi:MAG: DUF2779 domain-containing protein [Fimbriimonadaceae bacterium]